MATGKQAGYVKNDFRLEQQLMHYDLIDLKLFVAIADAGNVSRGGAACFLAPSSASLRIKRLEQALGAQLFKREARGVSLTRAGQVMLKHCRRCLTDLEQMHADLAPFANGIKAQISLSASSSAIATFVPNDLQPYLRAYPEVRISLEERLSEDTVEAVLSGRADLGIVTGRLEHPDLEFLPYRLNELVVVVPPDDPMARQEAVTFSACLDRPFICMNSDAAIYTYLVNQAAALHRHLDIRIQVSSFAAILSLIRAGAGIGLIPRPVLQTLNCDGVRLVLLDEDWAIRPLTLCRRRDDKHMTPYVKALQECLLSAAHAEWAPEQA